MQRKFKSNLRTSALRAASGGAAVGGAGASHPPPQPPILTIGKNLSSIDIKYDYSTIITKLYPRGTGSAPSELTLDNPPFFPVEQGLIYAYKNSYGYYFTMPNPYSSYYGFTKSGDQLPTGSFMGLGLSAETMPPSQNTSLMKPDGSTDGAGVFSSSGAMANVFHRDAPFRLESVVLQLQRVTSTGKVVNWTTQPRFVVGLYNCTVPTKGTFNPNAWNVPYQGPLTWCYGNLLSINRMVPTWYTFPLQSNSYPKGWYAIVVAPYPTSNKQWSADDWLAWGPSPAMKPGAAIYGAECWNGITPQNWMVQGGVEFQLATSFVFIKTDVTAAFKQARPDQPGRYVFISSSAYTPGANYIFHYRHAPYLINWDAYVQYGKIEGTYKDDSITTQTALLNVGSQYLRSVSEPVVTISLSAADLYDLDPVKNWAEELTIGGLVTVIDDVLGIEQQCVIAHIEKNDLTQPHQIDTLTLNNVHMSAKKLLAQLSKTNQKSPKYLQGQTVETPYSVAASGSSSMTFNIRDVTTLTHGVRLTVAPPAGSTFYISVDGNTL